MGSMATFERASGSQRHNTSQQGAGLGLAERLDPVIDARDLQNLLAERCALRGTAGPIEMRETHASQVFLTESDVYKRKKPVNLGFLNYSTLRRRGYMCRQELLLNRRLAPDAYLDVETVTRERDGSLRLNGRGRIVEYLVHMKRLPDECSLAALLQAEDVTEADLWWVGARIGRFHREAAPAAPVFGPKTFVRNARENLTQLRSAVRGILPDIVFAELHDYFEKAWLQSRGVLEARIAAGFIREGHGDLRAEHVYLREGITIIDCIEFNPRYRRSDTALDFAFLAMDVHALGYPELVDPLVRGYESAAADDVTSLLPLYCWYRALVRAKVAAILTREEGISEETRGAAALSLRRHVHHALRFARDSSQPLLVVVAGLPGTGKTTLARPVGAAISAQVISADEVRKRSAGLGPGVHPTSDIDSGLYSSEMNRRVYRSLMERAGRALQLGRSIVLDGTFRRPDDREAVRALAIAHGARLLMVECQAPDEIVEERLRGRVLNPDTWSDATVETFHAHRRQYEPPAGLERAQFLRVSTESPVMAQVDRVLSALWE